MGIITGLDLWSDIDSPDNGEAAESGDLIAGVTQPVANRFERIRRRLFGASNTRPIKIPMVSGHSLAAGTDWTYAVGSGNANYWTNAVIGSSKLVFDIDHLLLSQNTVTGIRAAILPSVETRAALPGTMPKVELLRRDLVATPGDAWTVMTTTNDASATVGAYEAMHYMGPTSISQAIDQANSYRWAVAITGESGTNSYAGTILVALYLLVTA